MQTIKILTQNRQIDGVEILTGTIDVLFQNTLPGHPDLVTAGKGDFVLNDHRGIDSI